MMIDGMAIFYRLHICSKPNIMKLQTEDWLDSWQAITSLVHRSFSPRSDGIINGCLNMFVLELGRYSGLGSSVRRSIHLTSRGTLVSCSRLWAKAETTPHNKTGKRKSRYTAACTDESACRLSIFYRPCCIPNPVTHLHSLAST